jgi:cation transport ATPase
LKLDEANVHQDRKTPQTPPTSGSPITLSEGSISIRDEAIFGPDGSEACARFLASAFAIADVRSATVDRAGGTVRLRHDADRPALPGLLGRLADSIRRPSASSSSIPLPALTTAPKFSLHRHGATLTTWEVVADEPGRLKIRQESLRGDPVAVNRIAGELLRLPGVHVVKASDRTGHLLVRYSPTAISGRALLGRAESTLFELQLAESGKSKGILARFGMANLTLGIAAAGEFLVPALLPVSAVLLVVTNARTFRSALRQLKEKQLGLPVLYIAIIATTLATGQFVASALMTWLFRFWDRRFRVELASERNRLLERTGAGPLMARLLVPSGAEVLVTIARLKPGDRLIVAKGDAAPADGRIVAGEGVVDERAVRGLEGIATKRAGDVMLAGSIVLSGSFEVEVDRLGEATRAASIRRALIAATSPAPGQSALTARSEQFASRAVGPTLATAGFGLLAGDLMAVGAILRPDYATGPGLAVPLETLHKVALCARSGIVARDADALERLAQVELYVLQDHPALRRTRLELSRIETRVPEPLLLRYAASAFRHLGDDRSVALVDACRDRRIHVLNLEAIEFGRGVTVAHNRHRIRVGEVNPAAGRAGSLGIEIDGTAVGVVEFAETSSPESASSVDRIRRDSHVPFALVSPHGTAEVSGLAKSLGVEMFRGDFTLDDTAEFLAACRAKGLKVAFVGDCRLHPRATGLAHVAISLADSDFDLEHDPAPLLIQQDRLGPLVDLSRIARDHASRVDQAQKLILVPNLLCIAGAFLFGFTGMTAVMLSNLGTLGLYRIASDSLRGLDAPTSGPSGRPRRAG